MESHQHKVSFLVSRLLVWFAHHARDLPWRRTRDPYAVWVSEIMLQQTQVKTVIPFWERWMRELPTIKAAAQAPSEKIHKLWEGLGYYTRVRNVQKAAQIMVEKHDGKFPETFEDVLALPGIGRYTAGAICSIVYNQPTPIVDGNVIRVLTRLFGIAENPKEKTTNARLWEIAEELVFRAKAALREDNSCSHLNQSLMELGALVCTPRNAQCLVCPVKKICVAFAEKRVEELPNLGRRPESSARRFLAFTIENQGRFLVRQRPAGVVNAQLWEFPNVEVGLKNCDPAAVFSELALVESSESKPDNLEPLCMVKHSITRYRITLAAFWVSVKSIPKKSGDVWKTPAQLRTLAFTSAHKKVLGALSEKLKPSRLRRVSFQQ